MSTTTVPLIPRRLLFGHPERTGAQLSPDGTCLAFVAPLDGVMNVWVGSIGSDDVRPVTRDTNRGVGAYFWQRNGEHLLYLQDQGGNENWRVYATDLVGGEPRDLTPYDNVTVSILKLSDERPNEMLIGLNLENPMFRDIFHLHIPSGRLTRVESNPGYQGLLLDSDWFLRGVVQMRPDAGITWSTRQSPAEDFAPVLDLGPEDAAFRPMGYTVDGSGLFVLTNRGGNATRLVEFDTTTGELRRVLLEHPVHDIVDVWMGKAGGDGPEVRWGVVLGDRFEYIGVDESLAGDLAAVQEGCDGDVSVVSRDTANTKWLVQMNPGDGPAEYHLWDRRSRESRFLFTPKPEYAQCTFGRKEPFSFTARDGLEIHGYLTFPAGVEPRNLPTIVNVHGGPWVRNTWAFDPEGQWFANRGYLAVQVNYRGSTGYGRAFLNAGDKEWGGKMHDDIIDAVEWVVARGYADRERIGIYGGSYGGYEALVAATFTPDVFRCAVDMCGPSDLVSFIESIPPLWKPMIAQFDKRVGNVETERELLRSRSPIHCVDRIKIPLLIAQGANDPRVKQAESDRIVAELDAKGVPHEYLLFEDEGHGLVKPENRFRFYAAVERFLAEHLGGRYEDDDSLNGEDREGRR